MLRWLIAAVFCPLLLVTTAVAQEAVSAPAAAPIDWSNPDSIGPLDTDLGMFVDTDLAAWQKTAQEAYSAGDYEKAIRYSLAMLHYDISDSAALYQVACCYGLLGNAELAAKYLERAVDAGFSDLGWAAGDPDFDKVRGQSAFDTVFATLQTTANDKEAKLGTPQYIEAPAFLRCRVLLPDGYDAGQAYPLIVGLHGYGANPENFAKLWERFGKHNFIFAIPQAPYAQPEGKDVGYSWTPPLPDYDPLSAVAREASEQYVCSVVADLHAKYHVTDTYLLGFSQGCAFTYTTGIKHHELFKGLLCFSGWLDDKWLTPEMIAAGKDLRVFISQGTQDRIIEPKAAELASALLKQNGYDVTVFTFDGEHRVPPEGTAAAEAWLGF
jgi:predicted esterase